MSLFNLSTQVDSLIIHSAMKARGVGYYFSEQTPSNALHLVCKSQESCLQADLDFNAALGELANAHLQERTHTMHTNTCTRM